MQWSYSEDRMLSVLEVPLRKKKKQSLFLKIFSCFYKRQ